MVCHCNGVRWFQGVGVLYLYLYLKGQLRPCARWAQQWCDIDNLQKSWRVRQYVKKVKANYDFKRLIQHDNLQRNAAQQFANKAIQYDNLQRSGPGRTIWKKRMNRHQNCKQKWFGTAICKKINLVPKFAKTLSGTWPVFLRQSCSSSPQASQGFPISDAVYRHKSLCFLFWV